MAAHPKDDHMAIGAEIFTALKAAFPDNSGVFVLHWAEPQASKQMAQFTPGLLVSYAGDTAAEGAGRQLGGGSKIMFEQRWAVSVIVKDAASQIAGQAGLDEAGPIIAKMIKTLAGLSLVNQGSRLTWKGAVEPFIHNSMRITSYNFAAQLVL